MNNIEEKRNSMRVGVNCVICCKLQGTDKQYDALCVTLSGTGISFICEQSFAIGAVVEVNIMSESNISTSRFFITIARCQAVENGNFEIGAIIQLPDDEEL